MEIIENKISKCTKCGKLNKLYKNTVKLGKTNFIIIGESPAVGGWIQSGTPFYNAKGKMFGSARVLEKLLSEIDLTLDDIYFTECCKCEIEDRKNLVRQCYNCLPFLVEQLNKLPCKVIVTMGKCPTQAILNKEIQKFGDYVGKEFIVNLGKIEYLVVPIYHTSPLNPLGYKGNKEVMKILKEKNYDRI